MKKNSGEKNEREEEFPYGRENEKKEREKTHTHTHTPGPNEEQCAEHTSLQRLGEEMFVMGICFYTFCRSGERERIYTRG